jgi:hypothetical protein
MSREFKSGTSNEILRFAAFPKNAFVDSCPTSGIFEHDVAVRTVFEQASLQCPVESHAIVQFAPT